MLNSAFRAPVIVTNNRLPCEGRLSDTTSHVFYNAALRDASDTIYWLPFNGNRVALYDGSIWRGFAIPNEGLSIKLRQWRICGLTSGSPIITNLNDTSQLIAGMVLSGNGFAGGTTIVSVDSATQVTVSNNSTLTGAYSNWFMVPADSCVDVYVALVNGEPALRFQTFWTNNYTRASGLNWKDGVRTQDVAGLKRYLGTVYTIADGMTHLTWDNSAYTSRMLLWNYYNRFPWTVQTRNSNASWNYTTESWREYNGGSGQVRGQLVVGDTTQMWFQTNQYGVLTAQTVWSYYLSSLRYNGGANVWASRYVYTQRAASAYYMVAFLMNYEDGINTSDAVGYMELTQEESEANGTITTQGNNRPSGVTIMC